MFETHNSIIIRKKLDDVFQITNDIEKWNILFDEYKEAKILNVEGLKITFKLTNNENETWQSSRLIDQHEKLCVAQRESPAYPFKYMQIIWTYSELPGGTEMIWNQYFDIDEKSGIPGEKAVEMINTHSIVNMQKMKDIIEKDLL
jgi:aromatase